MTIPQFKLPPSTTTILLFGNTGSGKTAQIGELAKYKYKKEKKRTRLCTADPGGWETVNHLVELGIMEVVPYFGDNPWSWIDHVVRGDKLNEKGEWVPGIDEDIGVYAFEGMASFASKVMVWMSKSPANIGGGGSFQFIAGAGKDAVKVGTNNMAHYMVAQAQVYERATQSQNLPGIVLWTAGDAQSNDDSVGGVVAPQIVGKARSSEAPSWFKYCWHLGVEVDPMGAVKHVLFTEQHIELQSKGMSVGMSNSRVPLDGKEVAIPSRIEPASIVQVLELLDKRKQAAKDDVKKMLGL
jgi:hypothetical protein